MKLLENCEINKFDEFVINHPSSHYMKTSNWARHKEREGFIPHFYAMEKEGQIRATALVLEKKNPFVMSSYFYIPWGFCIDYRETDLVSEFIHHIREIAARKKVMFIRMDPNVLRMERDIHGNEIENGENNEFVTELLKKEGFTHFGYKYGYSGTWVNRYTLVIDTSPSMDEIIRNFTKTRQNNLKRHRQMGITTRIGTKEDIKYLCKFEKQLTETQGFKPKKPEFFEKILDDFKEHAVIYITECSLNHIIQSLDEEIHSKKYAKDKDAYDSKVKELEKFKKLKQQYGDHVVLAAGLFIRFQSKSWDLYTYKNTELIFLKAIDSLHAFVIEDMKNHGVTFYDMCGFSGSVEKSDPYYGLYDYKRSFGSRFVEQIGQFDMILDPKKTALYNKGLHNINRVKRKVNRLLYLKKEKEPIDKQ